MEKIIEALAALEHERWARWQKYLHGKCDKFFEEEDTLTIPAASVRHWERQIATPYVDLSEREKDSDRKEVRKTLGLLADLGVILVRPV